MTSFPSLTLFRGSVPSALDGLNPLDTAGLVARLAEPGALELPDHKIGSVDVVELEDLVIKEDFVAALFEGGRDDDSRKAVEEMQEIKEDAKKFG